MIFARTWQAVLDGEKTQTRRLKRGSYKVGGTYAVQPGRGIKAVGRIRITRIWRHGLWSITPEEVEAEDLPPPPELVRRMVVGDDDRRFRSAAKAHFVMTFLELHKLPPNWGGNVWAFEFERVQPCSA